VIQKAWDKVSGEDLTRQALAEGMLLAEVYRRYGVL